MPIEVKETWETSGKGYTFRIDSTPSDLPSLDECTRTFSNVCKLMEGKIFSKVGLHITIRHEDNPQARADKALLPNYIAEATNSFLSVITELNIITADTEDGVKVGANVKIDL